MIGRPAAARVPGDTLAAEGGLLWLRRFQDQRVVAGRTAQALTPPVSRRYRDADGICTSVISSFQSPTFEGSTR